MSAQSDRSERANPFLPDRPAGAGMARRRTWAVLVSAGAVFVALLVCAAVANGPFALDVRLADQVARLRPAWLTTIMAVVTLAGSTIAVAAAVVVSAARGARQRDFRAAKMIAATTAAAWLVSQVIKFLIARPRPDATIATATFSDYAFPSGHATTAAALWGTVAWLLVASSGRRRRVRALGAWIAAMVLIDASRVELGAHWLSDVAAGSALGIAVLAASILVCTRPRPGPEDYLDATG